MGAGSSPASGHHSTPSHLKWFAPHNISGRNKDGFGLGTVSLFLGSYVSDERISTGYASFQLHRALLTAAEHEDEETRTLARHKSEQWSKVISRIQSGQLDVGSRTPVKGTPKWLTLEVVTGGFATGELSAAGDWLSFELELLARLNLDVPKAKGKRNQSPDRTLLNYYSISEQGFEELLTRARSGEYEITAPEEGALLVAAWLAAEGYTTESQNLIGELAPYFSKVRFYPHPAQTQQTASDNVFLRDVESVSEDLRRVKTPRNILAQREAIQVWQPFREKVVSFLLSTCADQVEGCAPILDSDSHIQFAADLVKEYRALRRENRLCRKPLRKDNLAQMIEVLDMFVNSGDLPPARRSRLGVLCTRYVVKRGFPVSEQHAEFQQRQLQQVDIPLFVEIAKIVFRRLARHPKHSGVECFDDVSGDVTSEEANELVRAGTRLPESTLQKLERCMMESAEVLLERQVIKSGDSLAIVLPQITGNLRASGIESAELRTLYAAIYRAFRRRRSLLLLDYESQIQLEELPWIDAIEQLCLQDQSDESAALAAMKEIARLVFIHFPYAIVPNKLLQEFRAVAKSADLDMPLVDELAADIFMGGFSNKFARAAQIAGELLQGSLYETYYRIDFERIQSFRLSRPKEIQRTAWYAPVVYKAFGNMCRKRAVKGRGGSFVAKNGVVIEQQQILTTQNLAVLIARLDLADELRPHCVELSQACFKWICAQLQIQDKSVHARLIKVKNSAYAWRQMVCFLSLATIDDRAQFVPWADEYLSEQRSDFVATFSDAVERLNDAVVANLAGRTLPKSHVPFLGWTLGQHWLL